MEAIRQLEQAAGEQTNQEKEEENATKEVIKNIWIKAGNDWNFHGTWNETAPKNR